MNQKQLEQVLKTNFGYDSFYPTQLDVINRTLSGKDSVVLMPTGGGKSICYQIPALVFDGLTVVVSPLIALMHDQVENLRSNGINAAFLNSSQSQSEAESIKDSIRNGEVKLLYVSPERIFANGFLSYLKSLPVKLFAIDEAHCVSSWGHHFRPEYKQLSILKEEFPETTVIALTATADRAVRADIGDLLGLDDPQFFIDSFDRPNLSLAVLPGLKKWQQLQQILSRHRNESGIIYCLSRKNTESLVQKLKKLGLKAQPYHAGMDSKLRTKVQTAFIQGDIDIVCATVAFGMGIDKANVRFVVHYNMPGNLEGYYQEIGRAGRDGEPAEAVLFYSYRDIQMRMQFINDVEDQTYKHILIQKLDRMKEFAEAQICRRSILLTYFSEQVAHDCGNCDVCNNPPQYLDGTIVAQKALSAIYRTEEQISLSILIDILRGSYSDDVIANNFQELKTFGIGRDTTIFAWQLYIQQLIQQGAIEIDYRDLNKLKLTPLSSDILFKDKSVKLVSFETIRARQEEQKMLVKKAKEIAATKKATDHDQPFDEQVFQQLRDLRVQIAKEEGKPPFMIFSDKTLHDMARKMPKNKEEMLSVHGVGKHKLGKYGDLFLEVIWKN